MKSSLNVKAIKRMTIAPFHRGRWAQNTSRRGIARCEEEVYFNCRDNRLSDSLSELRTRVAESLKLWNVFGD
jgi:hypothetical protein